MSQFIAGCRTTNSVDFSSAADQEVDAELREMIGENELRVEAVDTNHPAWDQVADTIETAGGGPALLLSEAGRLSARQTVLAVFMREQVVGHLCFRIEPVRSSAGRAMIRAKLDSFAVDDDYAGTIVETMLKETADERARLMKCRGPRVAALADC